MGESLIPCASITGESGNPDDFCQRLAVRSIAVTNQSPILCFGIPTIDRFPLWWCPRSDCPSTEIAPLDVIRPGDEASEGSTVLAVCRIECGETYPRSAFARMADQRNRTSQASTTQASRITRQAARSMDPQGAQLRRQDSVHVGSTRGC
jgi:hypothetical protein